MTLLHVIQGLWFVGAAAWAVATVFAWRTERKLSKALANTTWAMKVLKEMVERKGEDERR